MLLDAAACARRLGAATREASKTGIACFTGAAGASGAPSESAAGMAREESRIERVKSSARCDMRPRHGPRAVWRPSADVESGPLQQETLRRHPPLARAYEGVLQDEALTTGCCATPPPSGARARPGPASRGAGSSDA